MVPVEGDYTPPSPPVSWSDQVAQALRSAGQTTADAVLTGENALLFGNAPRLAGLFDYATSGQPTSLSNAIDRQVNIFEDARTRSPYASQMGDLGGNAAAATVLPEVLGGEYLASKGGQYLASKLPALASKYPQIVGAVTRALGYGTEGLVQGAAQGAGNTYTGNWQDYLNNAETGAKWGLGLGAGGGTAFGVRPPRSSAVAPIEEDVLHDSARNRYTTLQNLPAGYYGSYLGQIADNLEQDIWQSGGRPKNNPAVFNALDEMRNYHTQPYGAGPIVTPSQIESTRQSLTGLTDPNDIFHAAKVRNAIQDFYENPPPGSVVAGTEPAAAEVGALAQKARGDWAAYKRVQYVKGKISAAELKAESANSGLNFDNTARQTFRPFFADTPKANLQRSGYNEESIDALKNIIQPHFGDDATREAKNWLGGGGGLGSFLTSMAGGGLGAGGAHLMGWGAPGWISGPAAGAATWLTGRGLAKYTNAQARGRAQDALEAVARDSPLYAERFANAPLVRGPGVDQIPFTGVRGAITQILTDPYLSRSQPISTEDNVYAP
jgi:hypothetical protein